MKVIGLTGLARSGKDTACGMIQNWAQRHTELRVERLAFADPLKRSAAAALGYEGDDSIVFCDRLKGDDARVVINLDEHARRVISGREFLQNYGTEAHRNIFGEDFWTNVADDALTQYAFNGIDVVVITDVRFPNEAKMVHDWVAGEVWELERSGAGLWHGLEHASEAGVPTDQIDDTIHNESDLFELRRRVEERCWNTLALEP